MTTREFDFTTFQEEIFPKWEKQFRSGDGKGEYSYAIEGPTSLYGTTDMLISKYIMNELGELDEAGREDWASTINQFQDPSSGWFTKTYTRHYREHTTAYAIAALHLIDKKPAFKLAWKDGIISDEQSMKRWTKQPFRALWSVIWPGSHVISGVPAALAMTGEGTEAFFNWYFDFLDREVDPTSGFWRRGLLHKIHILHRPNLHDMAGAFHMYYIYEYFNRKWKYPEKVVDWTLRFQHENGLWGKDVTYCVDLDGIYCLTRSSRNAGGYRAGDIKEAVMKYLNTAETTLNDKAFVFKRYTNSHKLTGALCAIAECQKFYPELVNTSTPWRQSLDKACYI